jgi:site-specific DNA-methyltransferase (adenine-specific)
VNAAHLFRSSPLVALGDGVEGLRGLIPGSVGLVLSDLPSGETRAEFDRMPPLAEFWEAVWGALRGDGAAVLMASRIQFAAALIASQPDAFRYDLIWHKTVAGGFLNARHRPLRAHEFVLVFSRAQGVYNPQMRQGLRPVSSNNGRGSCGENYGPTGGDGAGRSRAGATDRFPWSVLPFKSIGTRDPIRRHPQQKPVGLLRWCVRTYSNPSDLVVDPFAGSGASGEAAEAERRRFLGWDSDPRFGKE